MKINMMPFSNSEDFIKNPYRFYKKIRKNGDLYWFEEGNCWQATSYNISKKILSSPKFDKTLKIRPNYKRILNQIDKNPVLDMKYRWFVYMTPPEHTFWRNLFHDLVSNKTIRAYENHIRETARTLLANILRQKRINIIESYALMLPMSILCENLGIPDTDYELLKNLTNKIIRTNDPGEFGKNAIQEANEASLILMNYFDELIAKSTRYKEKVEKINSLSSENSSDQNQWTRRDFVANVVLMLIAGIETTANLLGNGLLILLQNDEELHKLKKDPKLIRNAIEEILRFNSPIQILGRFANSNIEICGCEIKKGDEIQILVGAANRDPKKFESPNKFLIDRNDCVHLSFSKGTHYCFGANLARLECSIAIEELLSSISRFKIIEEEIKWRNTIAIRGLEKLIVEIS